MLPFKVYQRVTASPDTRDCSIHYRAKVSKRVREERDLMRDILGRTLLIRCIVLSEIVSIVVSIRVDKFYDKKVVWDRGLADKDSESYQTLAYEANRAVSMNWT